ncbi:hypothetical protein B0H19DRAFT_1083210 [Mycena capillaripes]|nr:hypothetical protein B0H19DRAFT_1083210 [Mycena capillaripes]
MPAEKGPLWKYFYCGEKQNSTHHKAYCLGCLNVHRPAPAGTPAEPMDIDTDSDSEDHGLGGAWFTAALLSVRPVLGEKKAMIAHLIDENCHNASKEARAAARKIQGKDKATEEEATDGGDESDQDAPVKKRKRVDAVEKSFKQSQLKAFKGINIPFNEAETQIIKTQFLHATISANLPHKLFLMFRSAGGAVIPDRKALSGSLLNEESKRVAKNVDKYIEGMLCTDLSYLIDVIPSPSGKPKDGEAMCDAFCPMIDKAEAEHDCTVGQLMLVDYFKVNENGAQTAQDTTEALGWIVGHERVRKIFDDTQIKKNGAARSYLTANMTRWTTHSISFHRLIRLKPPLYRRVKSHPPSGVLTEEQQIELQIEKKQKEAQVSKAFLQYLSSTGPFPSWEKGAKAFRLWYQGNNPILVWEQYHSNPDLHELADFALLLLGLVVNQGGNERDFSDFKIKKTRLRNRLGIEKIGADIRASHKAEPGLFEERQKRKNHSDERVKDLIAVLRYADALESGNDSTGDESQASDKVDPAGHMVGGCEEHHPDLELKRSGEEVIVADLEIPGEKSNTEWRLLIGRWLHGALEDVQIFF